MTSLEDIVKTYGWNDYMEMSTGRIYKLSQSIDNGDGTLKVPVVEDGSLIGFASMSKEDINV